MHKGEEYQYWQKVSGLKEKLDLLSRVPEPAIEKVARTLLDLLKSSDKSAGQIERELGITPGLLWKWRARYQALRKNGQEASLEPNDLEAARAEIRRLKRELSEVEEEREILKKRSTFSPREAHEIRVHRR